MKVLFLILALPFIGFGQNVNIPDANFKFYLVTNPSINTNGDSEIQVSEASIFNGGIYVSLLNISDLTGVEAFVSITTLNCNSNQLTSLDVSANTALTNMQCAYNQLTSLDVSANTSLSGLWCLNNQLTSLDVSTCTALTNLYCDNNVLTSLNLKNGNSLNNGFISAINNPNLSCIEVDNVAWSNTNWLNDVDATASFSLNCSEADISEINESNSLMIFPNPTSGDFTITGLDLLGTLSTLSLTDMNGTVVKVLDTKATKFIMGSIKPGVYFLNIGSGNKQEVLKIVKD